MTILEHAWLVLVGAYVYLLKEVKMLARQFDTVVTKEEYKETLGDIKDVLKDAVKSINTLNINMAKLAVKMDARNGKHEDSE